VFDDPEAPKASFVKASSLIGLNCLLGDDVPSEAFFDFATSIPAHPAGMVEVRIDVTDPQATKIESSESHAKSAMRTNAAS
jgi:hypothetical protein